MSKPVRIAGYAALLVFALLAGLVYRQTRSPEIPDVGEPFDVAKFSSRTVADDKNAFTLYREADKQFVDLKTITGDNPQRLAAAEANVAEAIKPGSALADTDVQTFLAQNQKSLAVWKRGTERSAALAVPLDQLNLDSKLHVEETVRKLVQLALLEADRVSLQSRATPGPGIGPVCDPAGTWR